MLTAYNAEFNHTNDAFRRPMRAALTALLDAIVAAETEPKKDT